MLGNTEQDDGSMKLLAEMLSRALVSVNECRRLDGGRDPISRRKDEVERLACRRIEGRCVSIRGDGVR